MNIIESESKYRKELESVSAQEYKVILRKYLILLVENLRKGKITNSQFDSYCFTVVLTNRWELNDPVLDEVEDICSELDIPADVSWWEGRDRDASRNELIELISKL